MNGLNRLHDTQRDFSRFVFQEHGPIPAGIKTNGMSPEQRLAIYRNNTRTGLTEALRDTYPVLNRLVGERFFNRLAEAAIDAYPPQSACLLSFGGQFAEVIAGFQAAQGLPYLADTARLEWSWHQAYHEADADPLSISALAQLDTACYERLGFKLHPTARFIVSNYPIAHIWACNQPGDQSGIQQETLIDLAEGGCRLLVYRPDLEVEITALDKSGYQFLAALASGMTLTQAVTGVMEDAPGFDVLSVLHHWLGKGLLTDFFII